MGFKVEFKEAPSKVEGALNVKESSIERAKKAFLKPANVEQVQAQHPAPAVDPAAFAASNVPTASGQISTEAFTALRAQANAQAEASAPQTPSNEGQTPGTPPENPASEATKPKEDEQPLSPRFAQLARQEKIIRARDAQLKADRVELQKAKDALAVREAELTDKYIPKDRLSRETLAVLSENGIDYDSITSQALADPADPRDAKIAALEAKIDQILGRVDQTDKSIEDSRTQSYNQAKSMIHRDVSQLVSSDPNFETIQATESIDDVVELIEKTFHDGLDDEHPKGTMLSVEEAATIVEDYLAGEAEKLARLKKIQARLAPKAESSTPTKQPPSQQSQPKPTLTNGMTSAPKKEYSARQRAIFAAQHGRNWEEKVGDKAS